MFVVSIHCFPLQSHRMEPVSCVVCHEYLKFKKQPTADLHRGVPSNLARGGCLREWVTVGGVTHVHLMIVWTQSVLGWHHSTSQTVESGNYRKSPFNNNI